MTQLHALMPNDASSVRKAGEDIFRLKPWVGLQEIFLRVAGSELPEHMLHRKPMAANDRLSAEDRGVEGDALKELVLTHDVNTL